MSTRIAIARADLISELRSSVEGAVGSIAAIVESEPATVRDVLLGSAEDLQDIDRLRIARVGDVAALATDEYPKGVDSAAIKVLACAALCMVVQELPHLGRLNVAFELVLANASCALSSKHERVLILATELIREVLPRRTTAFGGHLALALLLAAEARKYARLFEDYSSDMRGQLAGRFGAASVADTCLRPEVLRDARALARHVRDSPKELQWLLDQLEGDTPWLNAQSQRVQAISSQLMAPFLDDHRHGDAGGESVGGA